MDSHNVLRAGQTVVHGMTYLLAVLLVVLLVVSLLKNARDALRFVNFLLWAFVPVALYGIFQYVFGLRDFEMAYIRSGYSISLGELEDIKPRIFSTLNSPHAFGVCMAMLLVLATARTYIHWRRRRAFRIVDLILVASFAGGLMLSFGRTSWVLAVMGLAGVFFFTSAARTTIFYLFSSSAFLLIIFNSDYISDKLPEWEAGLPMTSVAQQQASRLGTYSDRLLGFTNLVKDKSFWTAFGVPGYTAEDEKYGSKYYSHDAFTSSLLKYGLVGVSIIGFVCFFFLMKIHRGILAVKDKDLRLFSAACASACFPVFFSGFLSGSSVGLFPVNFLFWSLIGCTLVIVNSDRMDRVRPVALPARPQPALDPARGRQGGRRPLAA